MSAHLKRTTANAGHEKYCLFLRAGIGLCLVELWRGWVRGRILRRIHWRARRQVTLRQIGLEARGYAGIGRECPIGWREIGPWGDLRRRRADQSGERAKSQAQQRQRQLLNQQPDELRDQPVVSA